LRKPSSTTEDYCSRTSLFAADVFREEIVPTVRFEVKGHEFIVYHDAQIPNMASRPDIHAFYAQHDPRILPFSCYEDAENRPYEPAVPMGFNLIKDLDVEDPTADGPGAAGGDNAHGIVLPGIIPHPAPPTIDLSKGKVQGGKTGPVEGSESENEETDSSEDQPGSEDHRLTQIAQAIRNRDSVTVCLRGCFRGYEAADSEVRFQRDHTGAPPASLRRIFQNAFDEIGTSATFYGSSGIPGSLL
jgi:hypothetical protein